MKLKEFSQGIVGPSVYIGIDPSLTGFAVCAFDGESYRAVVCSPATRGPQRLHEIATFLMSFLREYPVLKDIAIEGTVKQSHSASVLGELTGVVKYALYDTYTATPLNVPAMSLKKFVTGSGKVITKSQMLLSTFKRYGAEFSDDNACDAYGLARIASGIALTNYERDVIKKLDDPKFRL